MDSKRVSLPFLSGRYKKVTCKLHWPHKDYHYETDGPWIKFPSGVLSYPNDASLSKCTAITHNDFVTEVPASYLDSFEFKHYYVSLVGLADFFNRLDISFTGVGIDYQAQRLLLQQERNGTSTEFALQSIAYELKDFYVTITVKASANDEPHILIVDVIDNAKILDHPDNTHLYKWMEKGESQHSEYLKAPQLIDDLDAFFTIFQSSDEQVTVNPLKGMLVIGPNVPLPTDIKSFFQQPQYKLQEDLKEITQRDHPVSSASRPQITDETLFITIGHGRVNDESKSHEVHILHAKEYARKKLDLVTPVVDAPETAQTAYYLGHLNLLIDATVHLHFFSCYGSAACPDVMYMKEQSTLITYSSASKSLLIPIGIWMTRQLLEMTKQNDFSSAQIFYNMLHITPVDLCFGMHLPGQKLFQYSYLAQSGNAEGAAQTFALQFHQEVDSSIEFVRVPLSADKREELSFLNLFYNDEYSEQAMLECNHNQGFRQFIRHEWEGAFQTNVLMDFVTTTNATTIQDTMEKMQQEILEGRMAPLLQFRTNTNLLCCADVDFSLKDKYGWNALTFMQVHSMFKSNTDNTDFIQYLIRDAKVDFWTSVTFFDGKNSSIAIPPICLTNSQPITQILVDEYLHQKIAIGEEALKCVAETFKVGLDDLKTAIEEATQQAICIELGGLRLNVDE